MMRGHQKYHRYDLRASGLSKFLASQIYSLEEHAVNDLYNLGYFLPRCPIIFSYKLHSFNNTLSAMINLLKPACEKLKSYLAPVPIK